MCALCALQIASAIAKKFFVYGNLLDTAEVFRRVWQKPECRYLAEMCENGNKKVNKKQLVVADSIIENIHSYLSEMMATKGTRKTLNQQAFRTVVAACCGKNLRQNRVIEASSNSLVCI